MRAYKVIFCAVAAIVTIAAAVSVIIIFREEITNFFFDVRDKLLLKKDAVIHADEYTDYADV
jgi:hypothetical protein